MTDDEYYKDIVDMIVRHSDEYLAAMIDPRSDRQKIRHYSWLRLIGLMETWDIIL